MQEDSLSNLSWVSHKLSNHGRNYSSNTYLSNGVEEKKLSYNFTVAVRVKPLLGNEILEAG